MQQGERRARLLRLRRARGRRRAARRPARSSERRERLQALLDRARPVDSALRGLRRRAGRSHEAAQEQGLEGVSPRRPARATSRASARRDWLKMKTARAAGVHHRRLHEGQGAARRDASAPSILAVTAASGLEYVGNCRHRASPRRRSSGSSQAATARAEGAALRVGPEDAEGAPGRHRLGRAEARLRGRVRRVDARRPPARALLQGPARGQGGGGGAARAADRDRDPPRQARRSSSPTWTRSSGPRRGSPRATCSRTTATSRRRSSRTSGTGRSR